MIEYIKIIVAVAGIGVSIFLGINNGKLKHEIKENREQITTLSDSIEAVSEQRQQALQNVQDLKDLYEQIENSDIKVDTFISSDSALVDWWRTRFGSR